MRSILNRLFLVPAVMTAAAFATNAAMAETTLKIPFNFTVAGKICPAGTYTLDRNDRATMVTLKSKAMAQSFSWLIGPGDPEPASVRVVMKFDAEGNDHALHSIQFGPMVTANLDHKDKHVEHVYTRIVSGQ